MPVKFRNWDRAGKMFEFTLPNALDQAVNEAVDEAQGIYTEAIANILQDQPSDWTPKSESWAKQSGNTSLYFGKTGQFVSIITDKGRNQRGIRAKRGDRRVFVGARHDIVHKPSGLSMEKMAYILQATPDGSRDLFSRAYLSVENQLNHVFGRIGTRLK